MAAKLAFLDWPQARQGPKKGQKGRFGPPTGKTGNPFRSRAMEFRPVENGRFSPFPKTRFGPGTPEKGPNHKRK